MESTQLLAHEQPCAMQPSVGGVYIQAKDAGRFRYRELLHVARNKNLAINLIERL